MKTNDQDIEKVAVKLTDQRYANCVDGKYYAYKNGVKAGFKACEAKMMAEAASEYSEHEIAGDVAKFAGINMMSQEEIAQYFFTAGRLSGAKEAEGLVKDLKFLVSIAECDTFQDSERLDLIRAKIKQLEQGG